MMKLWMTAVSAAALFAASPAAASNFSFTGFFTTDDEVQTFDFTATGTSTVTLRSYSYAGGTNAEGTDIAAGGFDPILTLYDLATGARIAFQDDSGAVPQDPVTGARYDVLYSQLLNAGSYRVALSQFNNFGGTTLAEPFQREGQGNFTQQYCDSGITAPFCDATGAKRTGNWAFDILGVDTAVAGGVPEPATWALMIMGFGAVGGAMRRRSVRVAFAA